MQKHQKPSSTRGNLRLIFIFCAVVLLVITCSLLFRLFVLIRESKVDRAQTFTVAFIYKDSVDIVTISGSEKKLSHLKVVGQDTVEDTLLSIGLLPDAALVLQAPFEGYSHSSSYFYDAALHRKGIITTLSLYDLMRLALLTKTISSSSMSTESIHLSTDENSVDTIVSRMVRDQSLLRDDKTITVINASGVVGLGTKVARVLSNMGLTVVAINNGEKTQMTSDISYYGNKSYTVSRLGSLLTIVPKENTRLGLSDIILTLGKDKNTIFK